MYKKVIEGLKGMALNTDPLQYPRLWRKWRNHPRKKPLNCKKGFAVSYFSDPALEGKLDFNSVEAVYLIGSHSAGALATKSFSIL